MRLIGKPRIIVLGAGPAGLLAAHAAERRGAEVHVYSAPDQDNQPKKSELHGCQYLHHHIPGIDVEYPGKSVRYLLDGTIEQYRRKVYGAGWDGRVSPDEFGPESDHYAWDLRAVYDTLWGRWAHRITPFEFSPESAASTADTRGQLVFCTVPARALCLRPEEHRFLTQDIWAMGTRSDGRPIDPFGMKPDMPYRAPENTVQCNGQDAPRWYRAATVFGHSTLEWPAGPKPPISGVVAVQKPLSTDCDCHVRKRGTWHRLGRYGQWKKGVLVHEAYFEALVLR